MEERRHFPRNDVDEAAYASSEGSSTTCRVVNISADGAAIEVAPGAYIPDRFQLVTERDRMVRRCRVVWVMQNRIGVQFIGEEA